MTIQRFLTVLLFAMSSFALSGCLTTGKTNSNVTAAPYDIHPIADIAGVLPPYAIQIGDVLDIKLLLNPELEEQVTVRPDGMISTAVAQDIMAYGRTPSAVQADLNLAYAKHLSQPDVAVVVKSFAPTRFYVLGEVNQPGEYISVGPNLTLLQAISMAGNIKNSAKTSELIIMRRGAGDRPRAYRADYDMATSGLAPQADIRLAAYDVVFIPKTAIAEAYVQYEQVVQQFLRPSLNLGMSYRLDDNGN